LFQGLRCLVCGHRIHARCVRKSHLCRFEPGEMFFRYLLTRCLTVLLFLSCEASDVCLCYISRSRKIFQRLASLYSVFVVLSVIIVFAKRINIAFRVRIIIIIIVMSKHLCARNRSLSRCCRYSISNEEDRRKHPDQLRFFYLDTSNIVLPIDRTSNERSLKPETKNNLAVYRVFPYRYV
jgi:FlaA1/EpsC-like NDP-sugar epimerase